MDIESLKLKIDGKKVLVACVREQLKKEEFELSLYEKELKRLIEMK